MHLIHSQRLFGMAAALLGCLSLVQAEPAKAPPAPTAPPPPKVVVASPLVREIVEWDEYTGRFQPVDQIDIRARVSGYLESVHFREGQIVEKGDLLFVIDQRPFKVALDEARAQLQRARSLFSIAEIEFKRGKQLVESRAMSQELLDERRSARDSAESETVAARARVDAAELQLGFTEVRSPIKGRTSDVRVDVGNLVSGGSETSTLLTTVVSLDPIELVIEASEAEFLKYARLSREGSRPSSRDAPNPIEARLIDESTWTHKGTITFVDNRLDPASGTMRAKATFANPEQVLQPGVFARARIVGSGRYSAVLIPDVAVLSDQDRKIVMRVGADNVVSAQPVSLGPLVDGLRVVREGLSASDTIIIDGLLRARPGQPVTPEAGEIKPAAIQ